MLKAQAIGSFVITLSTFGVAFAVMHAVNAFGMLRVSAEGEAYGLDLHEHGISAYPDYVISDVARPSGTAPEREEPAMESLPALVVPQAS